MVRPAADGGAALRFEPDRFFLAPTAGSGVVRDRAGRLVDRCVIDTDGRWDHDDGAMHFDETYAFASGRVEVLNWSFRPDPQGRMNGSEASITTPVRAWMNGEEYHLRFKRHGPPPLDKVQLTYDVRFTLVEPRMAMKLVDLKLLGLTLVTLTAFHRHTQR
jgi:hypothetical protein